MIFAVAIVIMIVTIIVIVACYRTTVISMETYDFHMKKHNEN